MTRGARALGWVGLVATAAWAASCLVTSSAELPDPEQTAPLLLADTALPDPREILVVESGTEKVTFSATVRSDEDLGESIKFRLLLDYGVQNVNGRPYKDVVSNGEVLPTIEDEERVVTAEWFPGGTVGCHTLTLMVSHAFDETSFCPKDRSDSSLLTWFVFVCEEGQPCPPPIGDPRIDCPKAETRCPESADDASTSSAP